MEGDPQNSSSGKGRSDRALSLKGKTTTSAVSQPSLNQEDDSFDAQEFGNWCRNKSLSLAADADAGTQPMGTSVSVREMSVGQNMSGHRWSIEKLLMRTKSSFWHPILGEEKLSAILEREALDSTIEQLKLRKEDVALASLMSQGFASLWTNGIGKLYLLVYFIWLQKENYIFFWMEIVKYRQNYSSVYAFARKQQAQRIYSTFLTQSSPCFVHLGSRQESSQKFLLYVLSHLDSPNRALFDDYAYLLMTGMEHVFKYGRTADETAAQISARERIWDTSFVQSAVFTLMQKDLSNVAFLSSSHLEKALERLLECCRAFSVNPKEVQDRIGPFLSSVGIGIDLSHLNYKPLSGSPASMQLAQSQNVVAGGNSTAMNSQNLSSISAGSYDAPAGGSSSSAIMNKRVSMVVANSNGTYSTGSHTSGAANATPGVNFEADTKRLLDQSHTLLLCVDPRQGSCDFCFEALAAKSSAPTGGKQGVEDNGLQAYRCEGCGLVCHKHCKSLIGLDCVQEEGKRHTHIGSLQDHGVDLELMEDPNACSETLDKLQERLKGIQHQIEVELKIQQGLAKFAKARKSLMLPATAQGSADVDGMASTSSQSLVGGSSGGKDSATGSIDAQLQKSNQKLDILKRELQKCQLQKNVLLNIANGAADKLAVPETAGGYNAQEKGEADFSIMTLVHLVDSSSQVCLSSRFLLRSENSLGSLLSMVLEKFHISSVSQSDFEIYLETEPASISNRKALVASSDEASCKSSKPLMQSKGLSLPSQFHESNWRVLNLNQSAKTQISKASDVVLLVRRKTERDSLPSTAGFESGANPAESFPEKKVLAVIMETIETELGYIEDVELLLNYFERPMRESEYVVQAPSIFSNVEEILNGQTEVFLPYIKNLSQELLTQSPIGRAKILQAVEGLCEKLDLLAKNVVPLYESYCANLEFARLKLASMLNESTTFPKLLASWEANPKLRKLHIDDLLVKPMHRITRYPLLLRRLQGFYSPADQEYQSLQQTTAKIEASVALVNAAVRESNGQLKLQNVEESLDFNGLFEKVRVNNGKRVFVSETPFTIKRRVGISTSCLALLFGDLLLIVTLKKEKLLLVRPPIALEHLLAIEDSSDKCSVVLFVSQQSAPIVLQARSYSDRVSWMSETETVRGNHVRLLYNLEMALSQDYVVTHEVLLSQQNAAIHSLMSSNSLSKRPQSTSGGLAHRRSGTAPFQALGSFGLTQWLGLGANSNVKQLNALKLSEGDVTRDPQVAESGYSLASETSQKSVASGISTTENSKSVRRAMSLVNMNYSKSRGSIVLGDNGEPITESVFGSRDADFVRAFLHGDIGDCQANVLPNDGDIESVITSSLSFANNCSAPVQASKEDSVAERSLNGQRYGDGLQQSMGALDKDLPSLPCGEDGLPEGSVQKGLLGMSLSKRQGLELSSSAVPRNTPPKQSALDIDDLLVEHSSGQAKVVSSASDGGSRVKVVSSKRSTWMADGVVRGGYVGSVENVASDSISRNSSSRLSLSRLSMRLRVSGGASHSSCTNLSNVNLIAANGSPCSFAESVATSVATPSPAASAQESSFSANLSVGAGVQSDLLQLPRSKTSIHSKASNEVLEEGVESDFTAASSKQIGRSNSNSLWRLAKLDVGKSVTNVEQAQGASASNFKPGRSIRGWLSLVTSGAHSSQTQLASSQDASTMSLDNSYSTAPTADGAASKSYNRPMSRKSLTAALSFSSLSTKSLHKVDPGLYKNAEDDMVQDMESMGEPLPTHFS